MIGQSNTSLQACVTNARIRSSSKEKQEQTAPPNAGCNAFCIRRLSAACRATCLPFPSLGPGSDLPQGLGDELAIQVHSLSAGSSPGEMGRATPKGRPTPRSWAPENQRGRAKRASPHRKKKKKKKRKKKLPNEKETCAGSASTRRAPSAATWKPMVPVTETAGAPCTASGAQLGSTRPMNSSTRNGGHQNFRGEG